MSSYMSIYIHIMLTVLQFALHYTMLHKDQNSNGAKKHQPATLASTSCGSWVNIDNADDAVVDPDEDYDPLKPWLVEWDWYINTVEAPLVGMGIVCWWGVCILSLHVGCCDAYLYSHS